MVEYAYVMYQVWIQGKDEHTKKKDHMQFVALCVDLFKYDTEETLRILSYQRWFIH